jgi:hypothetical protein
MAADGDPLAEILNIEAHIEEVVQLAERCRKIILMSKVSVAAGGIVSLGIIVGAIRFDPALMVGAIAAVIGGAVVFESNTSTLSQALADMKAAEAYRTDLINRMGLTMVRDG